MMPAAYGLSLIFILCALSLAILRSGDLKPTVALIIGLIGVFATGYTVSTVTHNSESAWSQGALVQAPAQSAGVAQDEAVISVTPESSAHSLAIRRGDKIATDIFDIATAGVLANHDALQIASGSKLQVSGWAADSDRGAPCKRFYLGVDNYRFALPYGFARTDVASYFHDEAYTMTGYSGQVSATSLGKGHHRINFECLSIDGKTLFVSVKSHEVIVE